MSIRDDGSGVSPLPSTITGLLYMRFTFPICSLLLNLFPPQALPDRSGFFLAQHFRNIPLCADHGPKVIFVSIGSQDLAFGRGLLLRSDLKLRHSKLVGIEVGCLDF